MSKTFSKEEVAAHKTGQDLWIIVDEDVYDLTKFQSEHPGKLLVLSSRDERTTN
jgi:cytochrome b involved in lipid metabolism